MSPSSISATAQQVLDLETALQDAQQRLREQVRGSSGVLADAARCFLDALQCAAPHDTACARARARLEQELVNYRLPLSQRAHVLVAVDGSKPSHWAVRAAAELAASLDAELKLVHAVQLPPVSSEAGLIMQSDIDQELQAGELVLAECRDLVPPELRVQTMLRQGPIVATIIAAAREWPADLIVLGTRGHGKFLQLILGSTAEGVVRHAPCAVLTVGVDRPILHGQATPQAAPAFASAT